MHSANDKPVDQRRLAQFGVFELDMDRRELRKHGIKLKLRSRSFQILTGLLEHAGDIVTRDQLRQTIWGEETFVDFENGLNAAVSHLRLALGDSAETPRYVETVSGVGYSFIAPVREVEWKENGAHSPAGITVQEIQLAAEPPKPAVRRNRLIVGTVASVTALALAVAAYFTWPAPHEVQFHQLTFRRGQIGAARFAAHGDTILYAAQWDNAKRQIYQSNGVRPESRPLGFEDRTLASVSPSGELLLLANGGTSNINGGTLFRVPLNGGAPLEVDRSITGAEWASDNTFLVVRAVSGSSQLEYPAGKVLYKSSGWLSHARFSPDGRMIAFLEHPVRHDDAGSLKLYRPGKPVATLSGDWASCAGLAWHPLRNEIWFTAARNGAERSLWTSTVSGKLLPLLQAPGSLTLRDISRAGKLLISRDTRRLEMAGSIAGKPERNFSWLDWSRVQQLSSDGSLLLFDESSAGEGFQSVVYVQRTEDGSTIRVGPGRAMGLAPGGKSALSLDSNDRQLLRLLPMSGGPARELPKSGLEYQWARYFPDGTRVLALANEPGKSLRLYVHSLDGRGAKPVPVTPEMVVRNVALSPDGTKLALLTGTGELRIYPTEPGAPRTIPAEEPLAPIHWSKTGETIYVQHLKTFTDVPTRVSKLHLPSGRIEFWKEIGPADPAGVNAITGIAISMDERSYVYSYRRASSELYILDGLK